jgi:Cys-rich protein (TIGR01571 family)
MTKQVNAYFCYCSTLIPGLTGLFCPCVLFGRNVENLNEDTPWTGPCICHAIFIEGGIALATATAIFNGLIDPGTSFLIFEGLFFTWWMCGIYTGQVRQSLQKNYHLKVSVEFRLCLY